MAKFYIRVTKASAVKSIGTPSGVAPGTRGHECGSERALTTAATSTQRIQGPAAKLSDGFQGPFSPGPPVRRRPPDGGQPLGFPFRIGRSSGRLAQVCVVFVGMLPPPPALQPPWCVCSGRLSGTCIVSSATHFFSSVVPEWSVCEPQGRDAADGHCGRPSAEGRHGVASTPDNLASMFLFPKMKIAIVFSVVKVLFSLSQELAGARLWDLAWGTVSEARFPHP